MNKKLTLLGYSAINLPLIMELSYESEGYTQFDIIPNLADKIDPPRIVNELDLYNFQIKSMKEVHSINSNGFAFCVTDSKAKIAVYKDFEALGITNTNYANLVHPTSFISKSTLIDQGIKIEPLVSISSQSSLGFGVTVKRSSTIGHHTTIGSFSSINPGSVISGNVKIGEGTTIGSGATLRDSIQVGSNTIIGAGSVVTKSIPSNVVAFGNPCKVIKDNINE